MLADEHYRVGDRVVLIDTRRATFNFEGAGLIAGVSSGTVSRVPDRDCIAGSVLIKFDGFDFDIAVAKRRLLLVSPMKQMTHEI